MSDLNGQAEKSSCLLEVCVDDVAGLHAAIDGGADRIELCASLSEGGLTPSVGFMAYAAKQVDVPVYAMIRPRGGSFCYSDTELDLMRADIAVARKVGLDGVVFGAAQPDGALDLNGITRLVEAADGLDVTLHRVFDCVPDLAAALDGLVSLGIKRVLTSGGERTALEGLGHLKASIAYADGRVSIMPGGGVTLENVASFLALGVSEIHASCSSLQKSPSEPASLRDLGFVTAERKVTDREKVAALKGALVL